jgi:hypothetical protein
MTRLARSPAERTRPEDRRLKFYELRDMLIVNGIGAVSRTTRDDGAEITVCPRCGEREAMSGDDPAGQVPFTAWPVEVEQLLWEEEALIRFYRASSIERLEISPDEAQRMLDDEEADGDASR